MSISYYLIYGRYPDFGFSTSTILNWLIVLSVLLCGYLLHLKIINNRRGRRREEITIFLDVLAFGIIVVGFIFIITGFLSIKSGHEFVNDNAYIGYALQVAIGFSSFFIVAHHIRVRNFPFLRIRNFEEIFLFISFILLFAFLIYKPIYDNMLKKCNPNWLMLNESIENDGICKTSCYDKYGIKANLSHYLNNSCYCDIRDCNETMNNP